jgi:hypothetical protein
MSNTKKGSVPPMSVAYQNVTAGQWTYSEPKPNERLQGHSIYPRDGTVPGGPVPCWVQPALVAPFEPSLGKGKDPKEINETTNLNLECSVRETNQDVIDFYNAVDTSIRACVVKNSEAIYRKVMSEGEAKYKHRASLYSKSDAPPYLLRIKVHKTKTKFFKVVSTDENGVSNYERASLADIKPWSTVLVSVKFNGVYATPMSFGATYFAKSVLIFPPEDRRQQEEDEDPDTFDFHAVGAFSVTQPTTEGVTPTTPVIDDAFGKDNDNGDDNGDDDEPLGKRLRLDE